MLLNYLITGITLNVYSLNTLNTLNTLINCSLVTFIYLIIFSLITFVTLINCSIIAVINLINCPLITCKLIDNWFRQLLSSTLFKFCKYGSMEKHQLYASSGVQPVFNDLLYPRWSSTRSPPWGLCSTSPVQSQPLTAARYRMVQQLVCWCQQRQQRGWGCNPLLGYSVSDVIVI